MWNIRDLTKLNKEHQRKSNTLFDIRANFVGTARFKLVKNRDQLRIFETGRFKNKKLD